MYFDTLHAYIFSINWPGHQGKRLGYIVLQSQDGGQWSCQVCAVHVSSCIKSRLMQLVCNNLCIIYREGNEAFVDDDYELAVKVGTVTTTWCTKRIEMFQFMMHLPIKAYDFYSGAKSTFILHICCSVNTDEIDALDCIHMFCTTFLYICMARRDRDAEHLYAN